MSETMLWKELPDRGDQRGGMCVIECQKDIPFVIQRVFYDFHTLGEELRGKHANVRSRFAFISLAGSCTVDVDDGIRKETFRLDDPRKLLILDKMTWKVMREFSEDNVLLIMSDQHYDGSEYIRDYDVFKEVAREYRKTNY